MNFVKQSHFFILTLSLLFVGCGQPNATEERAVSEDAKTETADGPMYETDPAEVEGTTDDSALEVVTADVLVYGAWAPKQTRSVLGTVEAGRDITVAAEASGTLANVYVTLGERVRTGEIIAEFVKENDITTIQYQNALASFNATEAAAAEQVRSAEVALQNAERTTAEQMRQAEVNLQNAQNNAAAALQSVETSVQNALLAEGATELSNEKTLNQAYANLGETVRGTRTTMSAASEFLDELYAVSQRSRTLESVIGLRQIGSNDKLGYRAGKNMAESFLGRPIELLPITDDKITIMRVARIRAAELELLEQILRQSEALARNTGTSNLLSESARAAIVGQIEGYLAQITGGISGISAGISSVNSTTAQLAQSETGASTQISQAQAQLTQTAEGNAANILAAETALQNAKTSAAAQLEQARASLENAKASAALQRANAQTQINLARAGQADLRIKSPFAGVVSEVLADPFSQVSPGTPIIRLTDDRAGAQVVLNLTQREVVALQKAKKLKVNLPGGKTTTVNVNDVSGVVDPLTQKVRVELPLNPNATKNAAAGALVRAELPLQAEEGALLPLTAIGFEPAGAEVLVVNNEGKTERRTVQLGQIVGEAVEVTGGINPRDMVVEFRDRVTSGAFITPAQ